MRHQADAIMIGGRTARTDDPLLTDRSGKQRRCPLVRVVIEQFLCLSPESQLAQTTGAGPVIIFASEEPEADAAETLKSRGVEVVMQSPALDLSTVLEELRPAINSKRAGRRWTVTRRVVDRSGSGEQSDFLCGAGDHWRPGCAVSRRRLRRRKIADALQLERLDIKQHGRDVEITGYPARPPQE